MKGKGVFKWHNKDVYRGEWKDDLKSGQGLLTWYNGNRFEGNWVEGRKESGKLFEFASSREFEGNLDDDQIHMEYLHPLILKCISMRVCTYTFTGNKAYFQYLWQTENKTDRTHGICMVCRDLCVPKNHTKLLEPEKCYFGGNFYCDCGSLNLGSPCHALPHPPLP
eukprot:TRINITY_DN3993_c0_g2_i9.p1 TRINITY_DN3993_c0_g2~~TRINITY_DN3993_c0_g2_i9.p1  ORF type:complete len:166 (+),score=36.59 TRINITY_DN3993_c0_g2_i9:1224-1721(+)